MKKKIQVLYDYQLLVIVIHRFNKLKTNPSNQSSNSRNPMAQMKTNSIQGLRSETKQQHIWTNTNKGKIDIRN